MILEKTSVSQIQTFDIQTYGGCKRKWYFERVKGLRAPQTAAQKLGTEVDKQLEHYLKTGEDVLGLIARSGKRFLPPPKVRLLVQQPTHEGAQKILVAGLPLHGYLDVLNEDETWIDDDGVVYEEEGVHEVIDWKTSSNLQYAKKPHELAENIQMLGYGVYALKRAPWLHHVRLSHGTFQTKGAREALKTSVLCTPEHIHDRWSRTDGIVEEMKKAALAPSFADLEPNLESCDAYRGCPHSAYCIRPKQSKLAMLKRHLKTDKPSKGEGAHDMGMLSKLKTAAPPAASTPAPPAAPSVQDEVDAVMARVKKAAAEKAAIEAEIARIQAGAKPGAVNPPDASKSTPATSAKPLTAEEKAQVPPAVAAVAGEFDATPIQNDNPPPEPPKTKRGPGRPRKTAPAANEAPAATAEQVKASSPAPSGVVIYIDVTISGTMVLTPFDAYVREICAALEEQHDVVDIRCVPKDSALAYGGWRGAVGGLTRATPPADGVYVCNHPNEIVEEVLSALQGQALIIRGRAS